ncbi:hypothetical protein ABZ990_05695 [Streptomyces sp. NPDC046203]|uniref:hypothetical protein n=1 Tax=Streptomyces sp. NPDC046203 TaxID=3154602 RepID=UPI0033ED3242
MELADAVAVMAEHGFTAEQRALGPWHSTGRAERRVEFRQPSPSPRRTRPAVKCSFIEGAGPTCVLVDGLRGPRSPMRASA